MRNKIKNWFHHFPWFGIESFVKGPQETKVAQLAQYKLEFISFYSGNQRVERGGEINWQATAASVKTQEDRLFNQGVEHSISGKRENKHFSFLEIHLRWTLSPFPFSGWVFLFLPVTSCHSLIIHCTYLARSECAAQIEYHLVLRSETGNRVEIPSLW